MRLVNPIYVCSQSVTSLIGNNTAHNRGFDFHLLAILDLSVIPSIWQLNEIYTVHLRLSNQLHSCFKIHCMLVTYVNFKYFMLNQIVINFSLSSFVFFVLFNLCLRTNLHMVNLTIFWTSVAWGDGGRGGGVREIQQDTHSPHSEIPLTVLTCLSLTWLCVSLTFLCVLGRPNYDFLFTTKQKCKILLSKKNILTMQRNKKSTTAWWVYCSIFDYGVILNNSNFYFVSN